MNPDEYIVITSSDMSSTALNIGDISFDSTNNTFNVVDNNLDWITINDDTIDLSSITITQPVEFEDTMPSVAKVEDMCNDYPALAKAYENFRTIYKMVHQDWVGRQEQNDSTF
jgi:hypothetical protein